MPTRACLLLLACSAVRAHTLAKEYVCQDPDTGTLHGINTTWRSTTFCGNYTCKIRAVKSGQPMPKVMVNLFNPQARLSHNNDRKNHTSELDLAKMLPEFSKDNDRLLTKAEIHKITELLHTVKKSDLQAVIELYNVAQEIYKDMKVPDSKIQNSDSKGRASGAEMEDPMETMQNKISYWYEPLNEHRKTADIKPEGPEYKATTVHPYRKPYAQPYFYTQSNLNYPSYFTGPVLSHGDFGRLGYYHPQANPQSFSYPQQNNPYSTGTTSQRPCNPCPMVYQYQTPVPVNYPQRFVSNVHQYPPPFYNLTAQSYNNYYKGNPWAYYDYYRNLPYQTASQVHNNPNAEVVAEKVKGDENLVNTENKEEPWRTDPLTEEVINEIRANIAQRGKLLNIPLKKRIKLERAAKVIKLDQFNRKTRSIAIKPESEKKTSKETASSQERNEEERKSVENNEELEVYIEKVTCEPTTELGYFKIGNLTKPFPDCCPQKIEDKQR